MAINVEKIQKLMQTTANDVEFATALSNEVVMEKAAELDSLMREIQNNVVNDDKSTLVKLGQSRKAQPKA